MGKLTIIDSKKAASNLFLNNDTRRFFIWDEANVYASPALLDLLSKSRSANITNFIGVHGLMDFDYAVNEAFREQIVENCNNFVGLRQNSSINAEAWAKIFGTKETIEVTHQLQQTAMGATETGYGSARRVRKYLYHPDDIKSLKPGQAFVMSRDLGIHCKAKIHKPF